MENEVNLETEVNRYKSKITNVKQALNQIKSMVISGQRLDDENLKKEIVFVIEQELLELDK